MKLSTFWTIIGILIILWLVNEYRMGRLNAPSFNANESTPYGPAY